jgi:hypothetical protein
MSLPLSQFLSQLAASGVMSPEEIQAFQRALPPEKLSADDAQEFVRELLAQKKLTAYQATAIFQGKVQGLILDDYLILDRLGQGGMGIVFRAEHRRMGRVVALKVLPPAVTRNPEAVKRFQREVRAAARLAHPHIVAALDAREAKGVHFFVMEYVAGRDLSRTVRDQGPLTVALAVKCIVQAARGLEHAHAAGIIHRDIKPGNLLMDPAGNVKILDMGLARFDGGLQEGTTPAVDHEELTGTGNVMGTVDYMSPEQALDTKHADARSDIYSLGCSLYYLLTGRTPYGGDTVVKKILAHRENEIPSLARERVDITASLDAIYQRMIAKRPEERYQSMTEVIRALESVTVAADETPAATAAFAVASVTAGLSPGDGPLISGQADSAVQDFLAEVAAGRGTAAGNQETAARNDTQALSADAATPTARLLTRLAPQQRPYRRHLVAGAAAFLVVAAGLFLWNANRKRSADGDPASATLTATSKRGHSPPRETGEGPSAHSENSAPVAPASGDPDRTVAEFVLGRKGEVTISVHGRQQTLTGADRVPSEPFRVTRFMLVLKKLQDADLLSLPALPGLEGIGLQHNPALTGAIVPWLVQSSMLQSIDLIDVSLTDDDLARLVDGLPGLRRLDVTRTGVSAAGLDNLNRLPKLHGALFAPVAFAAQDADRWTWLQQVATLGVDATWTSDEAIARLGTLPRLQSLVLCGGTSAESLRRLSQLKKLNKLVFLDQNEWSAAHSAALEGFLGLQELALNYGALEDGWLSALPELPGLKDFSVMTSPYAQPRLSAAGVQQLANQRPHWRVRWNTREIQHTPLDDPDRFAAQRVLTRGGDLLVGVDQERRLVANLEDLPEKRFTVIHIGLIFRGLEDADILGLPELPAMETLSLQHNPRLTSAIVPWIVQHRRLRHLALSDASISDDDLGQLVSSLPNLAALYLDRTHVSADGLDKLDELPRLQTVFIAPIPYDAEHFARWNWLRRIDFLGVDPSWTAPDVVSKLATLSGLKSLQFTGPMSPEAIERLVGLGNLKRLFLSNLTTWTPAHGAAVERLSGLQEFGLQYGSIEDAWLSRLPNSPGIKVISLLNAGRGLTAEAVQRLANQRADCKVLLNGREIKPNPPGDSE